MAYFHTEDSWEVMPVVDVKPELKGVCGECGAASGYFEIDDGGVQIWAENHTSKNPEHKLYSVVLEMIWEATSTESPFLVDAHGVTKYRFGESKESEFEVSQEFLGFMRHDYTDGE